MINRKIIRDNAKLSVNVSALKGIMPDSKILVIKEYVPNLNVEFEGFLINDFFNAIICESMSAAKSVGNPDFVIFNQNSIYDNNIFNADELKEFGSSVILTNFNAVQELGRVGRSLGIFNVNYLPGKVDTLTSDPKVVRGIQCGLSEDNPGVHLALIMGGKQIFYTGSGTTYEMLASHASAKNMGIPVNIVVPKRSPFLNTGL